MFTEKKQKAERGQPGGGAAQVQHADGDGMDIDGQNNMNEFQDISEEMRVAIMVFVL